MITKKDIKEIYSLSPMQNGMLFHHIIDSSSKAYFEQTSYFIEGEINLDLFEKSFNKLINRYDILKTVFIYRKQNRPFQVVLKKRVSKIYYKNISDLEENEKEKYIREFKEEDKLKGFDLQKDILIRVSIIEIGEKKYEVIWSFPHIVMDGWCLGIITKDFMQIYSNFINGTSFHLQSEKPYGEFIKWLNKQDIEKAEEYWKKYVDEYNNSIEILNYRKTKKDGYESQEVKFEIDEDTMDKLSKISRLNQVTNSTILQTIWGILLSKYNNVNDVVFGSVVSGRPSEIEGIESMVGLFINTIPLRVHYKKEDVFIDLVKKVQNNLLESNKYSYLSLAEIQSLSSLNSNLINHLFVYENYPVEKEIEKINNNTGLGFKVNNLTAHEQTNYNFEVKVIPGEKINISFSYNSNIYSKQSVQMIRKHFLNLINQITCKDSIKIHDMELLTEEEKNQILYDFNDTLVEYPKDKTIQQLFEEQVKKTPDKVAVVYKERKLSYRELNKRANSLARILRIKGVGPEGIIGIMVDKSVSMIVGIMAVLKAGGAYLPIDPEYPEGRIKYILEDSQSKILLTQGSVLDRFTDKLRFKGEAIDLEQQELYREDNSNLEIEYKPIDLAYVIYTSGSTGEPKGVMVEHKSLVNLCYWHNDSFGVTEEDNCGKYAGFGFDASVWEIFPYLIKGSEIHIIDDEIRLDVNKLNNYFEKNNITICFLPTQMCEEFMSIDNKSLRKLVTGGDKLKKFKQRSYDLVNNYGPTECTVVSTSYGIDKEYDNIPIGKPISNMKAYILSQDGSLAPVGVPGELCIGGAGLARGYLNRSDLTKEKYIDNPFKTGEKIYKTGDLARWLPSGDIEFLGRIDNQVKIRGFRIELGEIENQLLTYQHIKEGVVLAKEDKNKQKYLCGYVVSDKELTVSEIKEHLCKNLPEYMIPSYFTQIEEMPITANGKIDRKALPEPEGKIETGVEYEAPRNETEEILVGIWESILDTEKIGINDNFFDLGGHSLKATSLISRIHKELDVEIPLQELFKNPSIKGISEYICNSSKSIYSSIEPVEEKDYYLLSSAQKRMYILNQFNKDGINYNIPSILEMDGELDIEKLKDTFRKVIDRHESLRTSFEMVDGTPMQRIHTEVDFEIEYQEAEKAEIKDIIESFIKPFDLSKAPLFRTKIVKIKEDKHILMTDVHHIVSDGVSTGILVSEFSKLYSGIELSELSNQYKDYALWQQNQLSTEEFKRQESYWGERFEGEIPVLNLPTNYQRSPMQSFEGDSVSFKIDKELKEKLQQITKESKGTLYMTLLAAYNALLYKYTGQEDIIVGSPIAGRPHGDLENIIGMFVNTLAMRNYPKGNKTFKELLEEVKVNALAAYENQDYQFEELVEKLDIQRDTSRNPLFDTMFVLQNMDEQNINLHDLEISPYKSQNKISKFDLTLSAVEEKEGIYFNIQYCTKLFTKETMERLSKHFVTVLKEVSSNQEMNLRDIDMISDEEKKQILVDFNDTKADYSKDITIHQLFEKQVERTPDNIAVVYEEEMLTYKELNEKSNQLARTLREKGVKADKVVGIMVERSVEMIIGIMGILKAGGAYLPIDVTHPEDRIKHMLEDSNTEIILTKEKLSGGIKLEKETIFIDKNGWERIDTSNIESITKPNDLAYVIFTSGSTGKAKGVMVENGNLVNLVFGINERVYKKYNRRLNIAQISPYIFDASVKQIFPSLLLGHSLCIIPEKARVDGQALTEYYQKYKIDISDGTPAHLFMIIQALKDRESLLTVKEFVIGGEALQVNACSELYSLTKNDDIRITNLYGPTECTDVTTSFYISPYEAQNLTNVPIGKPINNMKVYILDSDDRLAPVGVSGELCIGGDGVARGYQNRPELTKEKFVDNPFNLGKKMYRTGDLAKWLPDGNVEFLGRIDNQVKVRGYRVELGEIESQLLNHEDIEEAVVIVKIDENKHKYICGYVVGDRDLTATEMREYLSKELPEYMIPSYFIQMDKMPLTTNGKIDRKALPKPDGNIDTGVVYQGPRNEVEEILVSLWEEILNVKNIGINHNFFDLGGHSLKAIRLISRIHKVFNVEVSLQVIFKNPSIKGISEYISSSSKNMYSSLEPVKEKEYYPLSSAQRRMYVLNQFNKDSTSYNVPLVLKIHGELDIEKLEETFNKIIKRHDLLRTSFKIIEGEPMQYIKNEVDFVVGYRELKELDVNLEFKENQETSKEELINEEIEKVAKRFIQPFDFGKAPLMRAEIMKIDDNEYVLLLDMHHIISDGVSSGILVSEFSKLYDGAELPELRIQYKDYAVWQQEQLNSQELKKQEEYWTETFHGELPVLNMPTDYQRPAVQSFEGDRISFKVNNEVKEKLSAISKGNNATLYMTLLAAYNSLLYKYTGQEDIIVGSPIAGRNHGDLENIIGMFVNTLAMRNFPEGEKTFKELLKEVKKNSLEAYENQNYQFEDLVGKLDIQRDTSRNPLFDTMFVLQNMDTKGIELKGIKISPYEIENKISKFDLMLTATETENGIYFNLEYCTKLFKKETIARLRDHFINIIEEISSNSEMKLKNIQMISKKEQNELLYDFNNTKAEYPCEKTIQQLFEEQVERIPEDIAVTYGHNKLTYRELNNKANSLASILRQKGIKKDDIVAIMAGRSLEMIVGIVGILKAGGAYLPIDPKHPEARKKYMLEDSKCSILLSQSYLLENISFSGEVLNLDDKEIYKHQSANLEIVNTSRDLAYVIYTSGSTGKPKGVMIEHRALNNFINTMYEKYEKKVWRDENCLSLTNVSFDVSVAEIFLPLTSGGNLALFNNDVTIDTKKLANTIIEERITFAYIPPTILKNVSDILKESGKEIKLSKMLVGVESIKDYILEEYLTLNGDMKIINGYGPTEDTICATMYTYGDESPTGKNVPIGRPLLNTQIYILDKDNKPVAKNIPGELCISGDGLARGYLNRPELTKEKFLQNPFATDERMYKTGDLARWLPDGNIEFIGRVDNQIKMRGYRIELGEIENQLLKHENIKETVVLAKEDKNKHKYLCGYIVSDEILPTSEIREHLSKNLPDYMIPSYFIQIEKMPITANGKIDRRALPEPDGKIDTGVEYQAPRNETEEILVGIWESTLGIEKIGINDNFFDLGGHSLKATSLVSKIHKELNVEIPLHEVFKNPSIKGMSQFIQMADQNIYNSIKPVEEKEYYPLSSAQKRMYILNQFNKESTNYNMPSILEIDGKLDTKKLEEVFRSLVDRHETLRTSFEVVNEELVQRIHNQVKFDVEYIELEEKVIKAEKKDSYKKELEKVAKEFIRPFDLSKAPLMRVGIVKVKGNEHILLIDMHHIIYDGVSSSILVSEFSKLYDGEELPQLKIQYKDYAVWQQEKLGSDEFKKQESYWLERFKGELPVLNLITDYQRPVVQNFEGENVGFKVDNRLKEKLLSIGKESNTTLYMTLLAAYNTLLYKYTGQEDIIIGSPIAGRPHGDLTNIIGMFVNTLGMRNYPSGEKTFRKLLDEVKESSLGAFENQDYQFEELVEKLDIERDTGRNPLFDTMFALQNMEVSDIELNGLKISPYAFENQISKFDITLNSLETEDGIYFNFEYSTKLFKKETIEKLSKNFTNVLEEISANPEIKLREIKMIAEDERQRLLYDFNDTLVEYPKDKTIQQLFEEQVKKTPDKVAVVYKGQKLSYKELNERANSLAKILRIKGVGPEGIIGVMVDKSVSMIVGIMAVLKAGGAYLPIDPEYPEGRIKYILEDSQSKILLTQSSVLDRFTDKLRFEGEAIDLEQQELYREDNSNLEIEYKPIDLAYVIYTSGSTGEPKGVMVEHKSLVNLCYWHNDNFEVTEEDSCGKYAGFGFDASVWEIFPYLIKGSEIHIIDDEIRLDVNKLNNYFEKNNITICFLPTQMCEEFMSIDNKSLRKLVTGGDKLKKFKKRSYDLVNNYGPTECTVVSTSYGIDKEYDNIPIGKPISNMKAYILRQDGSLAPVGVPGELCIGGAGLARGYLGRPDLTMEKYIDNPFKAGEKIYKTGDLARWLPTGDIEFLGRIDNQVKIRGFRIELGEIENQLLRHQHIKEAIVLAKEDKNKQKYLCGYVVSDKELTPVEIKEHLSENLPEYMIPSYFTQIEEMPITANGKIDRKALPEPEGKIETGVDYEAPRNETEEILVGIWEEILGIEKIGINDNFFDLGGHSLKATSLISKIHKEINVEIPLQELFKNPSIKGMSDYISNSSKSLYSSIEPVEKKDYYPLSSAQKRMYVLNEFNRESTGYNMPLVLKINGEIAVEKLEDSFRKLINRHESLRTSFEIIGGEPIQIIRKDDEIDFSIEYMDIEELSLKLKDKESEEVEKQEVIKEMIAKDFVRSFDLSKAPLLRVRLVRIKDDEYILMADMHHIISDGVSLGILVSEFSKLYNDEELSKLRIQYKDYAVWQRELVNSGEMEKQEKYWLDRFEGKLPELNLPMDYERPDVPSFNGDNVSLEVDESLTKKLKALAKDTETTMYMILLAVYNILLSKYCRQEDIVVGSVVAGRSHADLENIIGMFVNTLAMRNYPQGDSTFIEFLEDVKSNTIRAFENQGYQFEDLVEKLNIQRDLSKNPLFDVAFTMQNMDIKFHSIKSLTFEPYDLGFNQAKFDLTLLASETTGKISLNISYSVELFDRDTIEKMGNHFKDILESVAENTQIKLKDIELEDETHYIENSDSSIEEVDFGF